ncbi:UNVERIFIED_CONTAM: ABC-type sugar transport system permease subunit [Acetivibrio alkalicellulosi]
MKNKKEKINKKTLENEEEIVVKKSKLSLRQKKMVLGYVFILPWLIGFLLFFVRNLASAFIYSFSRVTIDPAGQGYSLTFAGLENYIFAVASHASFNRTLAQSVGNMLLDVPLIIFFSLFTAIVLNGKFKGRTIMRAIFFLPVILLSPAIVSALESAMNMLVEGVSTIPPEVRKDSGFSIYYLFVIFTDFGFPLVFLEYIVDAVNRVYDIVRSSGVQILIFLAALQSIPGVLYEAAKIEGATAYETFWKVTLPMVSPLILTNVVYTIIDSFVLSEVVEIAKNTAFTNMRFGLSSAMSIINTLIICLILVFASWIISKKTFYYN